MVKPKWSEFAVRMADLEALKMSGAKLSGEVLGRVLRSHSIKVAQPNIAAKLVDSKITFKVKKGAKAAVESKREAAAAVELGKKLRKSKTTNTTVSVSTEVVIEGAATVGPGSAVVERVTISSSKSEPWSTSLSTAEAMTEATKHLVAADTKLAQVIGTHGSPAWERKGNCFTALARSIVYQQLAGKAATAIHGRLVALCGVLRIPLHSLPLSL